MAAATLWPGLAQAAEETSYVTLADRFEVEGPGLEARTRAALDAARQAHDDRAELLALRNESLGLSQLDADKLQALKGQDAWPEVNRRGIELARRLGDDEAFGRFLFFQGESQWVASAPIAEARVSFDQSIAVAQARHLDRLLADDDAQLALLEIRAGQGAAAIDFADRALVLYRRLGVKDPAAVLLAIARAQAQLGQRTAAMSTLADAGRIVQRRHVPQLDTDYHAAAAEIDGRFGELARANAELRQQLTAERAAAQANDEERLGQLKIRFEVDLKDRDNALLKARAAGADSRRLALTLMLALSVLVLGGGALLLILRLRAQRSSSAMLAQLARNGREMTFGLDQDTAIATLRRQLGEMSRATSSAVWLRGATGLERAGADVAGTLPSRDVTSASTAGRVPEPAALLVARCASGAKQVLDPMPAASDPRRARFFLRRRPAQALWVFEPLLDAEQVIGVVQLEFADGRLYGGREREIVRTTCLYAAVALANIRTAQLLSESEVELEQERTRDMLVHTARLVTVGSMASGIVHEMSHPVGAMMLQSSNAQASIETGEATGANEALTGIHREARRLQNLITRLRNLCRADPPHIEEIDVLVVLEDARVLFQPQLHMAGVDIVQTAGNVRVLVDAERVVLAIANIVFNAMDAMEGRDVRRIELGMTVRDGYACVDIRDTGPGLTPTQLAHLFEPFYTTKPPGKGLGLGLALSVKSLASMNGRIEAANHPGGGAVFTLCLPLGASSGVDAFMASARSRARR